MPAATPESARANAADSAAQWLADALTRYRVRTPNHPADLPAELRDQAWTLVYQMMLADPTLAVTDALTVVQAALT